VGSERAITHSDSSVLERHHLQSTFSLLAFSPFDIFAPLSTEDRKAVRSMMVELVLATDLSKHFEFCGRLKTLCSTQGAGAAQMAEGGALWTSSFGELDLSLVLPVAIKFADLGHLTKSNDQHLVWTDRITEELYSLGDLERERGVAISALCDRSTDTNIAKSQLGFLRYIGLPFYSAVADLIDPQMTPYTAHSCTRPCTGTRPRFLSVAQESSVCAPPTERQVHAIPREFQGMATAEHGAECKGGRCECSHCPAKHAVFAQVADCQRFRVQASATEARQQAADH
jgi:hypothetical protein